MAYKGDKQATGTVAISCLIGLQLLPREYTFGRLLIVLTSILKDRFDYGSIISYRHNDILTYRNDHKIPENLWNFVTK